MPRAEASNGTTAPIAAASRTVSPTTRIAPQPEPVGPESTVPDMQNLPGVCLTTAVEAPPSTPSVTGPVQRTKEGPSTTMRQLGSAGDTQVAAVTRSPSSEPQAPARPRTNAHE